jgi:hypothetical protein
VKTPAHTTTAAAATENDCNLVLTNAVEGAVMTRFPPEASLGLKTYYKSDEVLLDAEDVLLLKDGEEVTFMDWGNAFITEIVKDASGTPVSATRRSTRRVTSRRPSTSSRGCP